MYRIMFVCHGNICRSPMAEFIYKDLLAKQGLINEFIVASSSTSAEEIYNGIGNPVHPFAREELSRHGIRCDERHATQLKRADAGSYELFIGMDSANIRNMHRILGNEAGGKIHKLMEYTERGGDVADPWYSGRFDIAYRDIYDGCRGLLDAFMKNSL